MQKIQKILPTVFLTWLLVVQCLPAWSDDISGDEAEIRRLVRTEMDGAMAHDIDKVMSVYWKSPNFVLYDVVPGPFLGWDKLRELYVEYFSTFPGKFEAIISGLHVGVSGNLGYAFSLQTWYFHNPNGEVIEAKHRVTNIYQKIDGQWVCIHEHASLPQDILKENKVVEKIKRK